MDSAGLSCIPLRDEAMMLGKSHGYRFDGDQVALHAELSIEASHARGRHWALQLWACDRPHSGGALSGIKVAEAPLEWNAGLDARPRLDAALPARLPVGPRDYSMVLVLASGDAGQFDQVHDFANYPARERFAVPHFEGAVGYRVERDEVVVTVEHVRNPRAEDNLTGDLALELWALEQPYAGGEARGMRLAGQELPRIAGQTALAPAEYRMAFAMPPAGRFTLTLMLREWTAAGYDTRDYCNFAEPYDAAVALQGNPEPAIEPFAPTPLPASSDTGAAVEPPQTDTRISVQDASVDELIQIAGLNKRLALDVIKARPFTALEQLLRVRGIGTKRLLQLRSVLKV
jgi:hypothetical protein